MALELRPCREPAEELLLRELRLVVDLGIEQVPSWHAVLLKVCQTVTHRDRVTHNENGNIIMMILVITTSSIHEVTCSNPQ